MKFVNFGVANGLYRFYDSIDTKGIYNMTENIENTNTDIKTEMTVGEILRNARTTGRRKREIPTISKQLCIREEFLQALEDGNYSVIPENVYILGFARNYAMELGLDPDEIVGKLKREMGLDAECMDEEKNDVAACAIPDNRDKWYNELWMRMVKFLRRYWIWVLGGLVLLVVLVGGVIFINSIGTLYKSAIVFKSLLLLNCSINSKSLGKNRVEINMATSFFSLNGDTLIKLNFSSKDN